MASLEVRQLEYFVQTARSGSISLAARDLYVSHQTLSKALQLLEDDLGVALFERNRKGVVLTEFGTQLFEKAQIALDAVSACEELARSYHEGLTGRARIGVLELCFNDAGGPIDSSGFARICEVHPRADISFIGENSDFGLEGLLSGKTDMCMHDTGIDRDNFEGVVLNLDRLAVLVSKSNPLSRKDTISFEDLSHETFALPSHDRDFASFISKSCENAGFAMKTWPLRIGFASWAKAVAENDVVVVLPIDRAWRTTSTETVSIVPLVEGGSPVMAPLYLLWRKGRELSKLECEIRDMIVDLFKAAYPGLDECGQKA